jgi:hypothetical protein
MTTRAYVFAFLSAAAITLAIIFVPVILLDPYGTGRFTPIQRTDIATADNNYANPARIRDPRFNAAIIGNSRSMRLAPHRLNQQTELSFVTLAMPGLDPQTQITVADAFIRARRGEKLTLVWGLGDEWCRSHHDLIPFPRWLYEPSQVLYLANLVNTAAIRTALRRARILLGFRRPLGTLDGYEPDHPFWNRKTDPTVLLATSPSTEGEPVEADMPFIRQLGRFVSDLNDKVTLVLVFHPIYERYMPIPGGSADQRLRRCKSEIDRFASRSSFIDMQARPELASRVESFLDAGHYKDDIAIEVEQAIASRLARPDLRASH